MSLLDRISAEPVAFASVIRMSLLAGVAFGLNWTPAQIAALMAVVETLGAFLTRKVVTANPNLAQALPGPPAGV